MEVNADNVVRLQDPPLQLRVFCKLKTFEQNELYEDYVNEKRLILRIFYLLIYKPVFVSFMSMCETSEKRFKIFEYFACFS
jgi:hypothetical protein